MPPPLLNLDDFFYEDMRREFVKDMLTCGEEGDFLVRKSSKDDKLVISVLWKGQVRHFQPNFDGKNFSFGGKGFPSLIELINYHYTRKMPLSGGESAHAVLKRPKMRTKTIFDPSDIEIQAKLGEGNFGEVFKVKIKSLNREAAMKTLRATVPKDVRDTFMKEFNMMNTMKHENIVQCIGVVDDGDPNNMKILLELINKGALDKLLRNSKLTDRGKSRILLDVAHGMQYLHHRNIIHRDLAARNILVQRNPDGSIIGKVSDFGLSQEGVYHLKKAEQLPLKWLAPECLTEKKWTPASDVWSFGILMWEVWTNGKDPYSDIEDITDATMLKQFIKGGGHPKITNDMPTGLTTIMLSCWTPDHNARPTMDVVLSELEKIHAGLRGSSSTTTTTTTTTSKSNRTTKSQC